MSLLLKSWDFNLCPIHGNIWPVLKLTHDKYLGKHEHTYLSVLLCALNHVHVHVVNQVSHLWHILDHLIRLGGTLLRLDGNKERRSRLQHIFPGNKNSLLLGHKAEIKNNAPTYIEKTDLNICINMHVSIDITMYNFIWIVLYFSVVYNSIMSLAMLHGIPSLKLLSTQIFTFLALPNFQFLKKNVLHQINVCNVVLQL